MTTDWGANVVIITCSIEYYNIIARFFQTDFFSFS